MENFRNLGGEEWRLRSRLTLIITPRKIPLLKDIIYLLQDFNSLYTRLVLISKESYRTALTSPSYRRRFQAIASHEQLAIITVERGSLIKISLDGVGPAIDALRRLLIEELIKGSLWKWKHERKMAELQRMERASSIIQELSKLPLERPEVAELAKAMIPELNRIAQNPNMVEVASSGKDIRKSSEKKYKTFEA